MAALAAPFDTVNVCLSKGLGAPVGSVLAGTADTIREARRVRKLFGGGMRQAGVLGAAALVALDDYERDDRQMLRDDHRRARAFAEAVASRRDLRLVAEPDTNIVLFETLAGDASGAIEALHAGGVQTTRFGPTVVRATFHRDVDDAALATAVRAVQSSFAAS